MKIRSIILFGLMLGILVLSACTASKPNEVTSASMTQVTVYKSGGCGCCSVYTQYLKKQGLSVDVKDVSDVAPIKQKYNVPAEMTSCHTTLVGDYFVEGHVPVEAINKLLGDKPDILGIAMPGMPSGSPGMPGSKTNPFVIYAIHKDWTTSEFMRM